MGTFAIVLLGLAVVLLVALIAVPNVRDITGVVLFNLVLVLASLPPFFLASVVLLSEKISPMAVDSWRRRIVYVTTDFCWRLPFLTSCCWVRIHKRGVKDFQIAIKTAAKRHGRPVIFVANHQSFLDTLLLLSLMPLSTVWKVRMMVSEHLLKIPAIGTITAAMGHFSVSFKNNTGVSTDKEQVAVSMKKMEDYVTSGGYAAWYPEGKMAFGPNFHELSQYRAGGFRLCCKQDVEIWCCAITGNYHCWSRYASVGGKPSKLGLSFFRLCESSKDMLKVVQGDIDAGSKLLANAAQELTQKEVNSLIEAGHVGPTRASKKANAREPLLADC